MSGSQGTGAVGSPLPPAPGARPVPSARSEATSAKAAGRPAGGRFTEHLAQARAERSVRISAHARRRLAQQNVPVDAALLARLCEATDRAESKGARESLLILGAVGFIVNVPNRTVKTAVEAARMQEGVFTNIDSAVILK